MQYTSTSYSPLGAVSRLALSALCAVALIVLVMLLIPGKDFGPVLGIALGVAVTALIFGGFKPSGVFKQREKAVGTPAEEEQLADKILPRDLTEMGMEPMRDDDGFIFRYQGGYFRMVNTDSKVVRVVYPRIYTVPVNQQNLLARMLNRVNTSFPVVKLTAVPTPEEGAVTVHAFADIIYTSRVNDRKDLLRQLLSTFFDAQHALALSMTAAQLRLEADVPEDAQVVRIEGASLN